MGRERDEEGTEEYKCFHSIVLGTADNLSGTFAAVKAQCFRSVKLLWFLM